MRVLWTLLALLVIAGAASIWNSLGGWGAGSGDHALLREAIDAVSAPSPVRSPVEPVPQDPRPATPPESIAAHQHSKADDPPRTEFTSPTSPAAELALELATSAADRSDAGAADRDQIGPRSTPLPPLPPGVGEPVELGLDATLPSSTVERGSVLAMPDGTLRADDRFVIRGSGTPDDPYVVTWDLLMSAGETFQPRQGQKAIPQRVALLDGKHVRIEGYAAFPAFSFDPTEMLMMLNRWDGCCIGVPPTPFDAIEVKLGEVPRERRRQVVYFGTVEGKLEVEPYLVDSWLIGLYLLSDGRFRLDL